MAHQTRYDSDLGPGRETGSLEFEPSRVADVVGVHPRHERRPAVIEASIEGCDETLGRLVNNGESWISIRPTIEKNTALVVGSIIHRNDLEGAQRLTGQTGEAGLEPSAAVADR